MVRPIVYDDPKNAGIQLSFDMENGMFFGVLMDYDDAQALVDLVQNKLNGRLDKKED